MRHLKHISLIALSLVMTACASAPKPVQNPRPGPNSNIATLPPGLGVQLTDRTYFHQQDARWADVRMGGSGDRLASDGCLVAAAAMALSNLGFRTDPGDLTFRLKANDGFNDRGWLVWSGLERVTAGRAKTRFYQTADKSDIRKCLADGYYPLIKFSLDTGRSHWALVVAQAGDEYYLRDPMVNYQTPIPMSARTNGISALRCIGLA